MNVYDMTPETQRISRVHDLPAAERPRERLARQGAAALSNRELMALVVGTGSRSDSVLDLSERLLRRGLHALAGRSLGELTGERGLGPAKATRVLAALELGVRLASEAPGPAPTFRAPGDAARYLLPRYSARPVETFGLLALDVRHRLKREAVISVGCLTSSLVHPREVFQEAVVSRAAGLVLFHNHPSGDPEPSAEDVSLTRRLVAAGSLMGIEVLDHVILGAGRFVSLKDRGVLSSRVVYFDCASGASGDMLLGALVDLGLSLDDLRAELQKVPLRGFQLQSHRVHRSGLHATKVDVVIEHEPGPSHSHHQRGLSEILQILDKSGLEPAVRDRAAALFGRMAEAEASVHGQGVEEVHFHEVGAVDAIVDVVGGCFGLAWLKADRFVSSPLNVGTGTVSMSHGVYPVPPPATARLVAGVPVYGAGDGELLTPTGALLVTGHAHSYGPLPALTLQAVGNGAGSREIPGRPNVLRLLVGEDGGAAGSERVVVLECEIDDMSPQLYGPLVDRLLAQGALDVFYAAVTMKKGRPGLLVTVLAPPDRREALEEVLFAETTTLGVRRQEWERTVLSRERVEVATAYGPIGVKVGSRGGRVYNAQPEFEECRNAAEARSVPVKEVWAAALSAWRARQAS